MDAKLIDTLNGLIKINRERAAGYEKLTNKLKPTDIDLKTLFTNIIHNSHQRVQDLLAEVKALGGKPLEEIQENDGVYRLWADIKATADAHDRRSILTLCEFADETVLRAYQATTGVESPAEVKSLLTGHQDEIARSHAIIKRYRTLQDVLK